MICFWFFCRDEAVILEVFFFQQPRAQRSEIFSSRVLCVVCAVCVPNAPPAMGWHGRRTVLRCY